MARRIIRTIEDLEALYPEASTRSRAKQLDHINDEYATLINASPFLAMATVGPGGTDCSPRGDQAPVVKIVDPNTVQLPDRKGNNRLDSLRNIVADGRVSLLFLLPGVPECVRINGHAALRVDDDVLDAHIVDDRRPATVIEVRVAEVYFQCTRSVLRARLWDPDAHLDPADLPSPEQILASITGE